nr:putative late blight resistance protein homolog R1C-3 isoform X1 [Ipomoea trifida]
MPREITDLVHLRYLALNTIGSLYRFQFFKLKNLVTLTVTSWMEKCPLQLPCDILDLPQLRYLHVDKRCSEYLPCLVKKNLQTLYWLKVASSDEKPNFRMVPNLRELGIFIEGQLAPSYLGSLVYLRLLEKLKFEVGRVERFYLPTGFPPNLKKLTLRCTYLPWKEMDTIAELPHLEVLKLKDFAFCGSEWKLSTLRFRKLKALLISRSNLKHWNTTFNHFPVLERLVLRYCWELKQIPMDISDIGTLKLIVLECCCYSLVTSAKQISLANELLYWGLKDCPVRVRKVATKVESSEESDEKSEEEGVEIPECIQRFEEESVKKKVAHSLAKADGAWLAHSLWFAGIYDEYEVKSKLGLVYSEAKCGHLLETLKEMVKEIEEVEERFLMIKEGIDEGVWDTYQSALELENEVGSFDEKPNFRMVPNLMELGIYIEGRLAPSHLGSLVHLHLLEKLKFEVGRVERFCLPTGFPPNLKKLTLHYTYLPWKEMDTIGKLPHLEVLKLKDFAFCGPTWGPSEHGFRELKALLISRSNLEHWNASSNHFPVLERLVLRYCWELKQIPINFAEIETLKLIVLECCYSSLVTSANQISSAKSETLKGKEDCPLRVRKVGTKVKLPIIESFEEESVESSEEESVENSKEEMLKADNRVDALANVDEVDKYSHMSSLIQIGGDLSLWLGICLIIPLSGENKQEGFFAAILQVLLRECCYSSLVTSAMQISSAKHRALKGKANCPLRVRKVGTKVECPIIGRSEEEMLKADKSVMKYVKKLFW